MTLPRILKQDVQVYCSGDVEVKFRALLVEPPGLPCREAPSRPLPLAAYFPGLGEGVNIIVERAGELRRVASEPFVLVVPTRPKHGWWWKS